jgi:hypothetical protein
MSELERRYRRLLRVYPRWYRAEREDEILGVLMDRATPEQGRPTAWDTFDLVWAGLGRRLQVRPPTVAASAWSDSLASAAVLFVMVHAFGAIVVPFNAIWLRPELAGSGLAWRTVNWPSIVGWSTVAALLWVRRSLAAGLVASTTAAVGIGWHFLVSYGTTDNFFDSLVNQWSYLAYSVLAIAVAAILLRPAAGERGMERLGRAPVAIGAVAYALVAVLVQASTHDAGWSSRLAPELLGLSGQAVVVIPILARAKRTARLRPLVGVLAGIISLQAISELTYFYVSHYGPRPWVYLVELVALLAVPALIVRAITSRRRPDQPMAVAP